MVVIRMQIMHYEEIKQFKMYAMYVSKHHFYHTPKLLHYTFFYIILNLFQFIDKFIFKKIMDWRQNLGGKEG